MSQYIVPLVGSKGFHEFAAPFDTLALENTQYECKAVRRLSDILANNETPFEDIYKKNGLSEDVYDEDLSDDAYIVSFQSSGGHWLYVPYRYILKYPSVNGVPYKSVMVVVSLPSMPADTDLTTLRSELEDVATSFVGAAVKSKQVDSSKIILVPNDLHVQTSTQRTAQKEGGGSMMLRYKKLERDKTELLRKVKALEDYILVLRDQ